MKKLEKRGLIWVYINPDNANLMEINRINMRRWQNAQYVSLKRRPMFINLSNHSSRNWSGKQMEEACKYGEVADIPFPQVNPDGDSEYYDRLADECINEILILNPNPVVMVQGEFILTFRIVTRLKARGIKCVAAVTKREAVESVDEEGRMIKTSVFKFEQFMEY